MSVNTHVTRGAAKALPLAIWNVLFCLGISILLCHAKIDHCVSRVSTLKSRPEGLLVTVNGVRGLAAWPAYEKIIWFDVTVYQVLRMDRFYS